MSETYVEPSLMGGGDCFAHWHSEDRNVTHATLEGLQSICSTIFPTASYNVSLNTDYHLINTTAGLVVPTLPKAKGQRVLVFVRVAGTNTVVITPTSPETVNGAASLTLSTSYSPVRLLALAGVGYIQV